MRTRMFRSSGLSKSTSRPGMRATRRYFRCVRLPEHAAIEGISWRDVQVETMSVATTTAKFDLTLMLTEQAGELQGTVEYDTDLFDATTTERLASSFAVLLQGISADPDMPFATCPFSAMQDRQTQHRWNSTAIEYPRDRNIHEIFDATSQTTPDAIAAVCGASSLSYRELNRRANQLARHLRLRGVEAESRVGVYMDRLLDTLVGLNSQSSKLAARTFH